MSQLNLLRGAQSPTSVGVIFWRGGNVFRSERSDLSCHQTITIYRRVFFTRADLRNPGRLTDPTRNDYHATLVHVQSVVTYIHYAQTGFIRVVHGSILCDPIQPNPSADWPNPTQSTKKVNVAYTRLPSIGARSWSPSLAVSLQVAWVINPVVGCYFFPRLRFEPRAPAPNLAGPTNCG